MEFRNSFLNIAIEVAKKNRQRSESQLAMVDNFTMDAPILAGMPFQRASHSHHHVYSRLLNADNLTRVDFDGKLPTLRAESQLESVPLTAFGGAFEFGEDLMKQTHGTPEAYIATQVPPVLRKTGMEFERSLFINNFLTKSIEYGTARSAGAGAGAAMVAITWTAGEMTGLFSPLPYGSGERFGQLFETDWANGKQRHKLEEGMYGYAATIKVFLGVLLANKQKIASLVNITAPPSADLLARFVSSVNPNASTRIYCSMATKLSIAAQFAQQTQGNNMVSVTGNGEVSVLGVPIVTSNNIPSTLPHMTL